MLPANTVFQFYIDIIRCRETQNIYIVFIYVYMSIVMDTNWYAMQLDNKWWLRNETCKIF